MWPAWWKAPGRCSPPRAKERPLIARPNTKQNRKTASSGSMLSAYLLSTGSIPLGVRDVNFRGLGAWYPLGRAATSALGAGACERRLRDGISATPLRATSDPSLYYRPRIGARAHGPVPDRRAP